MLMLAFLQLSCFSLCSLEIIVQFRSKLSDYRFSEMHLASFGSFRGIRDVRI